MATVYTSVEELRSALGPGAVANLVDHIDDLVWTSTFATDATVRDEARASIRRAADARGCGPASIQALYEAMGRGELKGFTVPAINIRTMTYDFARAVLRVLKRINGGPVLFEIARSEIGYTEQRPGEYAASIMAAAVKEGWPHPVFIQGDHFQINAKKFSADAAAEVKAVKDLIDEAVPAGFYNIDLDSSTLVDLSQSTLAEQQRLNYEVGADLHCHTRSIEPAGVTISLGGEIGEVGGKNSTVEELEAYMDGYVAALPAGMKGISKISVQTGTEHGGVVLPDGSIKDVAVDFDTLLNLSRVARTKYGLAGAVQHGASTLPQDMFDRFPVTETAEIHLATEFQNIIYTHLPKGLLDQIYAWLAANCADERKAGQTDEQFYYKTRKKGFAPFKRELWSLDEATTGPMLRELEAKFELLFRQLGLIGTRKQLEKYYA